VTPFGMAMGRFPIRDMVSVPYADAAVQFSVFSFQFCVYQSLQCPAQADD
jgi:hypothetical protein